MCSPTYLGNTKAVDRVDRETSPSDAAEWSRRSVSNLGKPTRTGSKPSSEPLSTPQQSNHLSILPKSVNEYSEK